jgi:hypothetical protein
MFIAKVARCSPFSPARAGRILLSLGLMGAVHGTSQASAQVSVSSESMRDAADAQIGSYKVSGGETLWSLAERFLGSGEEWPRLWSYNPEITNPHYIYPGHVVRLREGAEGGPPADAPSVHTQSHVLGRPRPRMRIADPLPVGAVLTGELAYLDRDALKSVSRVVGSAEDHMMLSPTDEIYVKLETGAAPEPGKELTIFARYTRQEVSPRAGAFAVYPAGTQGEIVRILGFVRVLRFDEKKRVATCAITNALDPIERGHEVADVAASVTVVPAKPNAKHVTAHIVAATRAVGTLGQQQLVFINAGTAQGVEPGNVFTLTRQGDAWRTQLTLKESLSGAERPDPQPARNADLPVESFAQLRVVAVRQGSATAIIIGTLGEIYPGESVEMREGQ